MRKQANHHECRTLHIPLLAGLAILIFSGCTNTGAFLASNLTNVELRDANYNIVATDVSGTAEAGYLLGGTWGYGMVTSTLALARVSGSEALYRDALNELWKAFEAAHGKTEGRKLAMINVRYDSDNLNLILYTKAKVTVRADIVEFTGQ